MSRFLGSRPLRGLLTFWDSDGIPRLLMPGRTWEDYLTLALTEIREYGNKLNATVTAGFAGSVDMGQAQVGDPQGIGGPGRSEGEAA